MQRKPIFLKLTSPAGTTVIVALDQIVSVSRERGWTTAEGATGGIAALAPVDSLTLAGLSWIKLKDRDPIYLIVKESPEEIWEIFHSYE